MKITLKKLAKITSTKLVGDETKEITGVNTLEEASEKDASFLANPRYIEQLKTSKAGIFCVDVNMKIELDPNKNYLLSNSPSETFQQIISYFLSSNCEKTGFSGISEKATIHPKANISDDITVLPNATIDENVTIKEKTYIGANSYIGKNSKIGKNCIIHSNVTIRENCIINDNVVIQPGAVIGSCGFGFTQNEKGEFLKLNQMGNVIIEDNVEIGANTCIDRARFKSTIIKKGTKIDNLIQIAHNVEIGENSAIAAQTGVAGSSKIGDFVIIGGQVGITGHVQIASHTMLATRTGVSKNLKSGKYRGSPAVPLDQYNRNYVTIKNLEKTLKKLSQEIENLKS